MKLTFKRSKNRQTKDPGTRDWCWILQDGFNDIVIQSSGFKTKFGAKRGFLAFVRCAENLAKQLRSRGDARKNGVDFKETVDTNKTTKPENE